MRLRRSKGRTGGWRGGLALLAIVLVGPIASAAALTPAAMRVASVRLVPGAESRFPNGCGQLPNDGGDEAEPWVSVDPRNPRRVLVGFIASWPSVGWDVSADGGATFATREVPGLSWCEHGSGAAGDPMAAFGPDGIAYASAINGYPPDLPGTVNSSRIEVSRSLDGGESWAPSQALTDANSYHDLPRITADPTRPRTAYATWQSYFPRDLPVLSSLMLSRTTDGGAHWSTPQTVDTSPLLDYDATERGVLTLPDGRLMLLFARVPEPLRFGIPPAQSGSATLLVTTSDAGRSWTRPAAVGTIAISRMNDPRTGVPIDAPQELFTAAVAPDGSVYAGWAAAPPAPGAVMLTRSADGGHSWRPARPALTTNAPTLLPSLAVGADGTLGLAWYDLRNYHAGSAQTTTDYWFAASHDSGTSWQQLHVAGPFDLASANRMQPGNEFLGDYVGLTAAGAGFRSAFTQGLPAAAQGRTDIFTADIEPLATHSAVAGVERSRTRLHRLHRHHRGHRRSQRRTLR